MSDGVELFDLRSRACSRPWPKVRDIGERTAPAVIAFLKKSRRDFVVAIVSYF
jgi:hypothetical protein